MPFGRQPLSANQLQRLQWIGQLQYLLSNSDLANFVTAVFTLYQEVTNPFFASTSSKKLHQQYLAWPDDPLTHFKNLTSFIIPPTNNGKQLMTCIDHAFNKFTTPPPALAPAITQANTPWIKSIPQLKLQIQNLATSFFEAGLDPSKRMRSKSLFYGYLLLLYLDIEGILDEEKIHFFLFAISYAAHKKGRSTTEINTCRDLENYIATQLKDQAQNLSSPLPTKITAEALFRYICFSPQILSTGDKTSTLEKFKNIVEQLILLAKEENTEKTSLTPNFQSIFYCFNQGTFNHNYVWIDATNQKNFLLAIDEFQTHFKTANNHLVKKFWLKLLYEKLNWIHPENDNRNQHVALLQEAVKQLPTYPYLHYQLGTRLKDVNPEQSTIHFQEAKRLQDLPQENKQQALPELDYYLKRHVVLQAAQQLMKGLADRSKDDKSLIDFADQLTTFIQNSNKYLIDEDTLLQETMFNLDIRAKNIEQQSILDNDQEIRDRLSAAKPKIADFYESNFTLAEQHLKFKEFDEAAKIANSLLINLRDVKLAWQHACHDTDWYRTTLKRINSIIQRSALDSRACFFHKNYTSLDVGKKVGSGSYGEVYTTIATKLDGSTEKVAVKFSEHSPHSAITEWLALSKTNHPNIVKLRACFYECCERLISYGLVLELASCSLADRLDYSRQTALNDEQKIYIAIMISRALDYLHNTVEMLHLDIKPTNVLLFDDNTIRLCDFGFARPIQAENACLASDKDFVGTHDYQDNTFKHIIAHTRMDIFAFGMLLCKLTGIPRIDNTNLFSLILKSNRIKELLPARSDNVLEPLASQCFGPPQDRPDASTIKVLLETNFCSSFGRIPDKLRLFKLADPESLPCAG